MTLQTPRLLAPGEGEHWDFLSTCNTIKVDRRASEGALTVIEALLPPGFGPPPHRHDVEDEMFYVLEGEMTVHCADREVTYGPGGCAWLPKGLPHGFRAWDRGPVRMLQITTPAQFDDFVRTMGEPMGRSTLPEPREPDPERLARVCEEFQIEILGGPPAAPPV